MSIELSEQEQLRRQSLAALRELGIDPYPAARYEVTATAREIAENFDPAKNNFQGIRIAGRIMSRRIMGSASFFELQDHTGRIQVYIRRETSVPKEIRRFTTRCSRSCSTSATSSESRVSHSAPTPANCRYTARS